MVIIEVEVDKSFLTKAAIFAIVLSEFILIRRIKRWE